MILLDTHIWIWWVSGAHASIPADVRDRLAAEPSAAVSAMSCLEVALLVRRKRIALDRPLAAWFPLALEGSGIGLLPLTPEVAERAAMLPEHHKDPADRVIIATAIARQLPLLSLDGVFGQYEELAPYLVPPRK